MLNLAVRAQILTDEELTQETDDCTSGYEQELRLTYNLTVTNHIE